MSALPTTLPTSKTWIPPQQGQWTIDDYMRLVDPPGFRYELIEGQLYMSPSPSFWHQNSLGELFALMKTFVREHQLGTVVFAPMDVVIDRGETQTVVQPDLIFISNERKGIIKRIIEGAPDLLVEILSASTAQRDRITKTALYISNGVREYWIVDPENRRIEVWVARGTAHIKRGEWHAGDRVPSEVLEGFSVAVDEICPPLP